MTVLFLCRGNSARSQMAEGFANSLSSGHFAFASAGTWPSRTVHPTAIEVMSEAGVDISHSEPKSFTSVPKPIYHIVALCGQSAEDCPAPSGVTVERWDIDDPVNEQALRLPDDELLIFRRVRDDIQTKVQDLLVRLEAGTHKSNH